MNGPTARMVPEINLDEFERRLRSGATTNGVEDPLAELTRLVNMISRESEQASDAAPPSRMPRAEGLPPAAEPVQRFESAAPQLRGVAPPPPPVAPEIDHVAPAFSEAEDFELTKDERAELLASATRIEAQRGRARRWYAKTAGLAAVGVVLLGGAAALKIGVVPGMPKKPPFIAAAEGPTRVQPPTDTSVQSSSDATGLLMKDSASSAPVKIVSSEEQPVDLSAQTPNPSPSATTAATDPASPVAPSSETPVLAPSGPSATVAPLFPEAKPVKTVSVRPDGTLISADSTPSPTPPASAPSAKMIARVADNSNSIGEAAPEPATPKVDLPTKLSPPKSAARVIATKTDTTAPAAATETTPNEPLQLGSVTRPKPAKAPAGVEVASAAPVEAPAAETPAAGGWAVQFAAPRSEADAQKAISRLKSKYADALGDAELGVRSADVKGETIYRVRAGGLAKADAAALCSKVKASGGDCFIARN
jgi:hypothetical protein